MDKQISDKEYQDVLRYLKEDGHPNISDIDINDMDDIIIIKNTFGFALWQLRDAWIEFGKSVMQSKEVKFFNKCIAYFNK